ncbi:MAG: PDZ domain-containing protein [SAR324 cluster bacterium]|nr:PDZ domain-containing protein [SAR324 cluster bacterium]
MRIQLDYVDPHRIEPKRMLEGALDELSREVAEIQTETDFKQENSALNVNVEAQKQRIPFQSMRQLNDLNNLLQQMLSYIQKQWSTPWDLQRVEYALIQGLLSELDPHSVLLPKEIYSEFQINTRGNFGGVGLMVGIRKNKITVIAPIEDTPASKAGIRAMDRIVRIGDESTENMNLTDTVEKLRGEIGTTLVLFIMRDGFSEPEKFELVRETIHIGSVESTDLVRENHKLRYIKIKNFQESTDKDLASKLTELDNLQGLILDLRNNPGGLLDQAVKVSDQFLPEKKNIVSTVGNQNNSNSYHSHWGLSDEKLLSLPTIILINNGSASASEILAAALKNNKRAVLLGEQTFGKGSVQTIWQLQDNSALKLTVAKYLTPGNKSIQSVGVSPDIELYPVIITKDQMKLIRSEENKEKDLVRHFKGEDQPEKPEAFLPYLALGEKKAESDSAQMDTKESLENDFFVQLAQKILIHYNKNKNQSSLLSAGLEVQQELEKSQDELIVQELKKYDIDWQLTAPALPVRLDVNIQTEILSATDKRWLPAPSIIPVDSKVRFQIRVKNIGQSTANRLTVLTNSEHELFDRRELPLGLLRPGASQTRTIEFKIPVSMVNSIHAIDFNFMDHQKNTWASQQVFLTTKALPFPRFEFTFEVIDDGRLGSSGNGDQIIQNDEKIALRLKVKNIGNGISEKTIVLLKKDRIRPEILLSRSREDLGMLPPQKEKSAVFLFKVDKKDGPNRPITDIHLADFKLLIEIQNEAQREKDLLYMFDSRSNAQLSNVIFQAPQIEIEVGDQVGQVINRVTGKKEIQLKGIARDDRQLKDVFVFLNDKKIFFKTNMGKKPSLTLPFETILHLKEGHNQILVFARDQDNLTSSEKIQLWRTNRSS